MKDYNIKFGLEDLHYKSKEKPGKSEKEIAETGTFQDASINEQAKVNISVSVPVPFVDVNNMVEEVTEVCFEAQKKTHLPLGKILVGFQKASAPIEKSGTYVYSDKLIWLMDKLEKFVKERGGELKFSEFAEFRKGSKEWTLEQVKIANFGIDYLAKVITENKLSPYESILFLASWASENLSYEDILLGKNRDLELSDSIIPVFNRSRALCVGFAELANAVLNEVDFERMVASGSPNAGLLVAEKIKVSIDINESEGKPNHCQSLIQIYDPKYKLDGKFILDLTGALDKTSFRLKEGNSSANFGKRLFNDRFLYGEEDIHEVMPNYRYFGNVDDVFEEELEVNLADIVQYFKKLKQRTDEFTGELGSIKRQTFDSAIDKCLSIAKQHSLSTILEKAGERAF